MKNDKSYQKAYYENNKNRLKQYHREYYAKNSEKLKQNVRDNSIKNSNRIKKYQEIYRDNNTSKLAEYQKLYRDKNFKDIKKYKENWNSVNVKKLKEHRKKYNEENRISIREKQRIYQLARSQNDPSYKILKNMRRRINHAIKAQNYNKIERSLDMLGCTIKEFREYLENKFQTNMTWGNYGHKGWHIDHIVPCSSFDLTDNVQQKQCFHYTNMQPLWWYENLAKSNKII